MGCAPGKDKTGWNGIEINDLFQMESTVIDGRKINSARE
jgi:hypothetical protein